MMSNIPRKNKAIPLVLALLVLMTASLAMITTPVSVLAQSTGTTTAAGSANSTKMAATGTINLKQASRDFLNDNLNATLIDAATVAENQIANSTMIAGHLDAIQGFLVYNITVADLDNSLVYQVYIDPANSKVISRSSTGTPLANLSAMGNITNLRNTNVTLIDAADIAENQVPNGMVIAGSFDGTQSSNPVYKISVVAIDNTTLYQVNVNATSGKLVSAPVAVPLGNLHIEGVF